MTSADKKYKRVKLAAAGILSIAALAGVVVAVRVFPDLRRYSRIERM